MAPDLIINRDDQSFLRILLDIRLNNLTADERWVWVALHSYAHIYNLERVSFDQRFLLTITGAKPKSLKSALIKLQSIGLIKINGELPEEKSKQLKLREPAGALPEFSEHAELLKDVNEKTQRSWLALYSDANWINREITHAANWLREKALHRPKTGAFISNWLKKSAEQKPPTPSTKQRKVYQ